jgi:hypothetical protein
MSKKKNNCSAEQYSSTRGEQLERPVGSQWVSRFLMKLSGGDSLCFLKGKKYSCTLSRRGNCKDLAYSIFGVELNSMLLLREFFMVNFSDHEQNQKQIFCFASCKYLEIGTTSMWYYLEWVFSVNNTQILEPAAAEIFFSFFW